MPKPKKCKNKSCGKPIPHPRPLQKACSPRCAIELHRTTERKKQRTKDKRRLEQLKTKSQLLKEAQYEFNRYIRQRDQTEPCISCGRYHDGQYHAGHYISTGAATELRFYEDNCHKQCAPCNNHLSGNQVEYRKRLIEKIGLERVEGLEGPHDMPNWTPEEIRAIKQKYREKVKGLKKVSQTGS